LGGEGWKALATNWNCGLALWVCGMCLKAKVRKDGLSNLFVNLDSQKDKKYIHMSGFPNYA
jgi:hypothetical protein